MTENRLYELYANAFSYPVDGYQEMIRNTGSVFSRTGVENSNQISGWLQPKEQVDLFVEKTKDLTLDEYEELYTRTFDINPVASLEIGWHLWGEAYERGAFLVTMRSLLRKYQIVESNELPDHLTHVLILLGKMEKAEADVFVSTFLTKALDKILEGFKEKDNPYEHIVQSLQYFVIHQHQQGVNSNG